MACLFHLIAALFTASCAATTYTALFVDNHDIMYTAGVQRELHQLERVTPGVAAVKADKPWERMIAYTAVAKVGDDYHMWYQAWSGGASCVICYASSKDGLTWTKPDLNFYTYGNISKTNIVLQEEAAAGAGGLYFGDVLYDAEEKNASRRFKMVLFDMPLVPGVKHGSTRPGVPGIWPVYSASPTGPWQRPPLSDGPLLTASYGGSPPSQPPYADQQCDDFKVGPCGEGEQWIAPLAPSDVNNLLWDVKTKTYRCYHKTWIDGIDGGMYWKRAIAVSTAQHDFEHWDDQRHLVLYPDELDGPATAYLPGVGNVGVELHGGPTFYHSTAGVYFMLAEVLDWTSTPTGDLRCELAVARGAGMDGDWHRPFQQGKHNGKFFFDLNPVPDRFDSGVLWMAANPQTIGNRTLFYYGAYAYWNADASTCKFGKSDCSGIGIASMIVDRFAALQPMNASYPAQLTTKPLTFTTSSCLTLNVEALQGSSVRVELLDAKGNRVHGYEKGNATAIVGDDVAAAVSWQMQSTLPDGRFSARLHFNGAAKVFALSVHTPCQRDTGVFESFV